MSLLKEYNWVYDILIYERQLGPSIQFVDRHPEQVFVLDHIAAKNRRFIDRAWKTQMYEMAKRENKDSVSFRELQPKRIGVNGKRRDNPIYGSCIRCIWS